MYVPFVLTRLAALSGIMVDRVLFKNDLRNAVRVPRHCIPLNSSVSIKTIKACRSKPLLFCAVRVSVPC